MKKESMLSKISLYSGLTVLVFYSLVKGLDYAVHLKQNNFDNQTRTMSTQTTQPVIAFVDEREEILAKAEEAATEFIDDEDEVEIQSRSSELPSNVIRRGNKFIYNLCEENYNGLFYDFKLNILDPKLRIVINDREYKYCRIEVPYKSLDFYDYYCVDLSKSKEEFFKEILKNRYPTSMTSCYLDKSVVSEKMKDDWMNMYQTVVSAETEYQPLFQKFEKASDYYYYLVRINETLQAKIFQSNDINLEQIVLRAQVESIAEKVRLQEAEAQKLFNQLKNCSPSFREFDEKFQDLDLLYMRLLEQKTNNFYDESLDARWNQQIQAMLAEETAPSTSYIEPKQEELSTSAGQVENSRAENSSTQSRYRWIRRALNYGTPIVGISLLGIRFIVLKF